MSFTKGWIKLNLMQLNNNNNNPTTSLFADKLLSGKKQGEEMYVGCYHLCKNWAGENRYTCVSLEEYMRNW